MSDEIMVSISCITYNHQKYIRECLESLLMQKTDFKYEILIHDDASTDRTSEIIEEYRKKYPDIIKPIFQKLNQYTQGIRQINYNFNYTRAQGKYIAICEGDDYWTDSYKLKKQVDFMEKNPECTFNFHNAIVINEANTKKSRRVIPWLNENKSFFYSQSRKYTSGELQLLGFIPTASFMFPKYVINNPPEWFLNAPVGDNSIKLLASSHGYAFYTNEDMCIYRFNVLNSETTKWLIESKEVVIKRIDGFLTMLDAFNLYTDYKYEKDIELSKLTWKVQKIINTGNNKKLKNEEYKKYLEILPIFSQMKIFLFAYFPSGFKVIKKIKNLLRR